MHAYREKTFSRGIGCVTEPAWQSRSRNLMLVSHMRIGFEIHMEGVLYSPWVLLHLRTLTWLAQKPTSISTATWNLSCGVAKKKTAISIQATTGVYVKTVSTPPKLHRSACVGNESLPPQFPFFTHWSSVSRSVEFSLRSRTRRNKVFEPEAVGPTYLSLTDFPLPSHGSVAFACGCTSHGTERRKAAP